MPTDPVNESSPQFRQKLSQFYHLSDQLGDANYVSPIFNELQQKQPKFTQKRLLALGGMKKIFTVNDQKTSREIALAELKEDTHCSQEEIEQFLREARVTAALDHPNIVPVYDIGINIYGKPYFTMKFLRDESLHKVLKELRKANPYYVYKFPLPMLLEVFVKVCDALAFAHANGVVHLDIKPDNIMLGSYGEVYICDWGLAKILKSDEELPTATHQLDQTLLNHFTLSGTVKGTPGFMAPEQINPRFGQKNTKTDIYAIGALLYSILTLKKPFSGQSVKQMLENTVNGALISPAELRTVNEVPKALSAVCMKAMAVKQSDRYETLDLLIEDIRAYQNGFATAAENPHLFTGLALFVKRHKIAVISTCVVLLSLFFLGLFFSNVLEETEELGQLAVKRMHDEKGEEISTLLNKAQHTQLALNRALEKKQHELNEAEAHLKSLQAIYGREVISINFTKNDGPRYMQKEEIAGVIECAFWQNLSLQDNMYWDTDYNNFTTSWGQASGVAFDYDAYGSVGSVNAHGYQLYDTPTASSNNRMMSTWSDLSHAAKLKFKGLNKFAKSYDVIIYSARDSHQERAEFKVGGQSLFTADRSAKQGPFEESKARSLKEAVARGSGNYVRFRDLRSDSLVIEVIEHGDSWVPICGIQIIKKR